MRLIRNKFSINPVYRKKRTRAMQQISDFSTMSLCNLQQIQRFIPLQDLAGPVLCLHIAALLQESSENFPSNAVICQACPFI